MRLRIELPGMSVTAGAVMFTEDAPSVTEWLHRTLVTPFETRTRHAIFDGHEVYCLLPGREHLLLQNRTMRPAPGDVMFFFAEAREFAFLSDPRLSGGAPSVYELAFCYGEVDLRHYWEEGMVGSLIGHIDENFCEFAAACARTVTEGSTSIVLTAE